MMRPQGVTWTRVHVPFISSAAKAEIGVIFINSRQAIPAKNTVEEMGHVQPPTPIQTNNTTTLGFGSRNLQPKATKSADMKYWWLWDRSDQKIFDITGAVARTTEQITGRSISALGTTANNSPEF